MIPKTNYPRRVETTVESAGTKTAPYSHFFHLKNAIGRMATTNIRNSAQT